MIICEFVSHVKVFVFNLDNPHSFLASVGREQDFGDNNVTFPNGSINEAAVQERSAGLFEQVPCKENVRTIVLPIPFV